MSLQLVKYPSTAGRSEARSDKASRAKIADAATVTQLAFRLKGEGANYGFTKISEFGGTLAQAIEGRDFKTARNVTQKLMAYLGKAIEQGAAA